jgi:1,4-dihydroxy-2-naphthoyl-CoA hydrolase
MTFIYYRTIRFQDTDAAGVLYFANTLAICHEAYEESLIVSGINVCKFFSNSAIALPITHADADYYRPAFCGDQQEIHLTPEQQSEDAFKIHYKIYRSDDPGKMVSKALTQHVCINPVTRERQPFPAEIQKWLEQWSPNLSSEIWAT